ncbi:porin, partial [uncultured Muribaculum sp.]
QAGIFNGTGSAINSATKTFSDDWHIPSLLYACRFTFQPKGVMPATQGNPRQLDLDRMLIGVSASLNVESENESTNDFRAGAEFAWLKGRMYIGAELYYMRVGFTKRQKIHDSYSYTGGYIQGGYFITDRLQGALRYDLMDRNGLDRGGLLNMPAAGINYFFKGCNLKLQAMYQYMGRVGHDSQLDRDNDNLGLAMHSGTVMIQYTF